MNGGAVALFFGTRPQVIKASVLRDALGAVTSLVTVDTGQHYDYSLHKVHYDQLGVAPPDVYLGVGSGSHAVQTAALLVAAEQWIVAHRPRLAVVIGDTNSTLACALAAAKARIPVAHVEAGLRARTASWLRRSIGAVWMRSLPCSLHRALAQPRFSSMSSQAVRSTSSVTSRSMS